MAAPTCSDGNKALNAHWMPTKNPLCDRLIQYQVVSLVEKSKTVDAAIINFAEAVKVLRATQAAGLECCLPQLIDEFNRANMAL